MRRINGNASKRQEMSGFAAAAVIIGGLIAAGTAALAWQSTTTGGAIGAADPSALIASARSGQRITLPASTGQTLSIVNRQFSPAIVIDARAATLQGIVIRNSSGVYVDNGRIIGPGGRSYGVNIVDSNDVRIRNMAISGAHRGIVMGRSTNVQILNNQLVGVLAEGVNLANSQRVLVQGNRCANFRPTAAVYTADGERLQDGDHPDCIQAWSRPDGRPTGDVRIVGNRAEGRMQGVFFGNHVRNGVDDGGFDRIVIENNIITVSAYNGIYLHSARGGSVRNNRISTIPGLTNPRPPYRPVEARMMLLESRGVTACGNVVEGQPTGPGLAPCNSGPGL